MSPIYELRRRRVDLKIQHHSNGPLTPPTSGESFFVVDQSQTHPSKRLEISKNYGYSFCLRILNRNLSPQEEAEWIKKTSYSLEIPSGVLRLGSWFPPPSPETSSEHPHHTFMVDVQIPAGSYILNVYEFYHRLLLVDAYLESISDKNKPESYLPIGQWFRESYPNRMFPPWLYFLCTQYPELDPHFLKEWIHLPKFKRGPFEEMVSYLLHFSSSKQDFEEPQRRKPEKCPMGIPAKPVNPA